MKQEPFTLPSWYLSRTSELDQLSAQMIDGPAKTLAIVGLAGAGKTVLAYQFAERFRKSVPNSEVLFGRGVVGANLAAFDRVTTRPTLLVIDDFDEDLARAVSPQWFQVMNRPNVRTVLVSRTDLRSFAVDGGVRVGPLTRLDSSLLVARYAEAAAGAVLGSAASLIVDAAAGNPLTLTTVLAALSARMLDVADLERIIQPTVRTGLLDADGNNVARGSPTDKRIITDVGVVGSEFLRYLAADSRRLYDLAPRQFEEVVAELLSRLGYEVTLTPISRDGGKDIYAAKKDSVGSFLYLVECKKYGPDNPVGVGLARIIHQSRAQKRSGHSQVLVF